MYINETHIGYYAAVAIIGLFVGMFVDWMNKRLPEYKKVFSKEIFTEYFAEFRPNYILMFVTAAIYVALLYFYGIKSTFIANLDLIKFAILTPMLLSAFVIDYKLQIIPNRLNLTMFEIGLVIAFLYGLSDVAITINMALGMLAGGGIFLLITLVSFLIGAVLSVILLITKIKKMDEYIPFGPFIVIGTFISMFVPFEVIKNVLLEIFTLGLYSG